MNHNARLAALILAGLPLAGASRAAPDDPAGRDDLLALLAAQTELATRTGMNADFVPGMATILDGDELLLRGARTVWEALALVPGISQGLEMTGERQILGRGVGFGYASGQIKLLLDGIAMNAALAGGANPVLNLPIEQVERIEVVRGPGAALHGEYAFAAVVNIRTRQQSRQVHVQAGADGRRGGGFAWSAADARRGMMLSINLAAVEGDGGVPVAADALQTLDQIALSHAPGHSNEAIRYRDLLLNLRWGAVFGTLQALNDRYGDHFGINHFLPPDDGRLASRRNLLAARLGRDLRFSETLNAQVRLETRQYGQDRDRLYVMPAGLAGDTALYMDQDYGETRWLAAAELRWRAHPRHALLFGLEVSRIAVDRAGWEWPDSGFALPPEWLDTGRARRILSAFVQDEFHPADRVDLTASLRLDDYSDLGSFVSPRLAAVWRLDDRNILKFQYARAFRQPSFYELEYPAAGRGLDTSGIATYELGYIFRRPAQVVRLILFESALTRPIGFSPTGEDGYVNRPGARLRGLELEYEQRLGPHLKLDTNLSYVDARQLDDGQRLTGGASVLANLALLWQPVPAWTAALQVRHVGARERSAPRDDLPPQTRLDLSLRYRPQARGIQAQIGIRNLTDTALFDPDQPVALGGIALTYPDGYPRPGRQWWLSVGYDF